MAEPTEPVVEPADEPVAETEPEAKPDSGGEAGAEAGAGADERKSGEEVKSEIVAPDSCSVSSAKSGTAEGDGSGTTATTAAGGEADYFAGAKVDLAFLLDTTGSMGSYIESARVSINDIAAKIKAEKIDVRFALVPYKDHSDKPLTEVHHFTKDNEKIKKALDKQMASGGGDGPEAVATGLFDVRYKLKWRNDASKVIVLIADAPPHGIEPSGDDYPNECPLTAARKKLINSSDEFIDILGLIRGEIRDELEATIYTVACEPSVSCSYSYCRDFMVFAAECTDGKFLPLSKADLLPPSIIGSVKQQIAMDALENRLEETMEKIKSEYAETHEGKEPTDEEMDDLLTKKFQESGMQIDKVDVGEMYVTEPSRVNVDLLLNDQECPTLKVFKKKCQSVPRMDSSNLKFLPSGSVGGGGIRRKKGKKKKRMVKKKAKRSASPVMMEEEAKCVEIEEEDEDDCDDVITLKSAPKMALSSASAPSKKAQKVTMSREMVSLESVKKTRAKSKRKKAYRSSKMT